MINFLHAAQKFIGKIMKQSNKIWKPLKLIALDDKDLSIFSDCIYQAILVSSEINYDN